MNQKKGCSGMKFGVLLLVISFILLPINTAMSFTVETPETGPSKQKESQPPAEGKATAPEEPVGPSTTREQLSRRGNAGSGASKDLESKKWWWIGGGLAGIAAVVALAGGGGGGGGGGGIPFFIPPASH